MSKTRVLEISLASVFVNENGAFAEEAAANVLTATLVYPRPRIAARRTVKTLSLLDAQRLDLEDSPLERRLLFKETARGPFPLLVRLTAQVPGDEIPRLAERMLRGVAAGAVGLVTSGVGTPLLGAGLEAAERELPRTMEAEELEHGVLGAGSITVDPAELEPGEARRYKVLLTTPETLRLRRTRALVDRHPDLSTRFRDVYRPLEEELLLEAGGHAGSVDLSIRVL